jgi:hypothetical protein
VYSGSSNDEALNAGVSRFTADSAALNRLQDYETTGELKVPLVTLHTTSDPIVPFSQSAAYGEKADDAGATAQLTQT